MECAIVERDDGFRFGMAARKTPDDHMIDVRFLTTLADQGIPLIIDNRSFHVSNTPGQTPVNRQN